MAPFATTKLSPSDEKRLSKGKRRKMYVSKSARNVRKTSRNSGQPYISARKQPVPGKLPPSEGRICKCSYRCEELQNVEEKIKLFTNFHALDYNEQNRFLSSSCVKISDVIRRYTDEGTSRRNCTVFYFVPRKDEDVRVCKKTFCDIFKVTERRLTVLIDKIKFGRPVEDHRGTHDNRPNKVRDEVTQLIKSHISSFPKQENHYSRHESSKLCLNPDLSVKKMWELYCVKYPLQKCALSFYRDIFKSEFNLRFGVPRSDTCSYCDRMFIAMTETKNEEELKRLKMETTAHHMKADGAYKTLTADTNACRNDSNTVVLCVDLQQVLFCPKLTHSNVFYERQLSCYNLAIHNQKDHSAMFFLWNESIAKRGAAEISSCVFKYIQLHFPPLQEGQTRNLVLWSDRCVGQNNNWRMVTMLQQLILMKFFTCVEQKFLITGHSFLPCDRDFALIERAKKTATVYVPDQWMSVIVHAKQERKFMVCNMKTSDFVDMSYYESKLCKGSFKITEHVWMQMRSDDPTTLRGRKSHNILQPWTIHNTAKPATGRGRRNILPTQAAYLPSLYGGPIPIKRAKKQDLLKMLRYIPKKHRAFYLSLQCE